MKYFSNKFQNEKITKEDLNKLIFFGINKD